MIDSASTPEQIRSRLNRGNRTRESIHQGGTTAVTGPGTALEDHLGAAGTKVETIAGVGSVEAIAGLGEDKVPALRYFRTSPFQIVTDHAVATG